MRIAFLGKGGSGKTTAATGLIRHLLTQGKQVLAIDADLNAHLQESLDVPGEPLAIGDHFDLIASYVRGERSDLGSRPMIGTTPPGIGSRLVQPAADDPLLSQISLRSENLSLVTVGGYSESDIGTNCYHGKLSSLSLLLNHLIDGQDDWVVIDATAGTDTVSTSLYHAYDLQFFVIEPTIKSVSVYLDYLKLAGSEAKHIIPIANKVRTDPAGREQDLAFLREKLQQEVFTSIPLDLDAVRSIEQGQAQGIAELAAKQAPAFERILEKAQTVKRDWKLFRERNLEAYSKACESWYDAYYGQKLFPGVGAGFTYSEEQTPVFQ